LLDSKKNLHDSPAGKQSSALNTTSEGNGKAAADERAGEVAENHMDGAVHTGHADEPFKL